MAHETSLALLLALAVPLGGCDASEDEPAAKNNAGQSTETAGAASSAGGKPGAGASGGGSSGTGTPAGGKAGAATGGKPGTATGGKAGAATGGKAGGSGSAPPSSWMNVTGNLAGMQSECGNLTLVSAAPDSGTIIAGVAKGGLFASDDGGAKWSPLGSGAGSAVIVNRPSSIVYDPEHAGTFWETGIYNGGGLYRTTDAGETFEQLGDISHNDSVSIDFSQTDRQTLLVGGHEQKQTLYLSTNGGQSFEQIGPNLPDGSHFSTEPLVLDAETFLVGSCGYGDGTCGVYRSADAGENWTLVSDLKVQAHPLWASDGSIYWTTQYDGGIARGNADGSEWAKVADGILTAQPVELPDGRILALGADHVVVSADQGESWDPVGEPVPFKPAGVAYSVQRKTLFIWHWDCGEIVLPDAIASAGFDYTRD